MSAVAIPEDVRPQFKLTVKQDKARDMLISEARHCGLGGGSRSGKTFLLVRQVVLRALKQEESRHAIFRFRFNALKSTIIADTLPKVMKLCFPSVHYEINKTDWVLTFDNGSEIWFGGLDDKERTEKILGMEFATIYFNECSQIPFNSVVLARTRLAQKTEKLKLKCFYDFNPPSKMHWTYLFFIEKKNPIDKTMVANPMSIGFFFINPLDNIENLDPATIEELESLPEAARKRFLLGQFADDSEGAYWTVELLAQQRKLGSEIGKDAVPSFLRIVVAVDPSGCSGPEDKRSDEIGITVCALGTDTNGYLIEDLSGRYKPEEWGKIAVDAYERHSADCIVGEVNYGGDMVRSTIHAVNSNVPYKEVRASRGKVIRAEPISALYERGRIFHVGQFPTLEDQLCSFLASGYIGHGSPDRADSAIWGFTELFPQMTRKTGPNNGQKPKVITSHRGQILDRNRGRRPTRRMSHETGQGHIVNRRHIHRYCHELCVGRFEAVGRRKARSTGRFRARDPHRLHVRTGHVCQDAGRHGIYLPAHIGRIGLHGNGGMDRLHLH